MQNVPEHPLDHIPYSALGISHAYIQWHLRDAIGLLPRIVPQKDISHLGSIPMGDDQVVSFPDQKQEILKSIRGILFLFINGTQLVIAE
jgi:hypothetical protein